MIFQNLTLSSREFYRNVLTLMTGATIAQAIPIAISPILTRIYTPEDFGIFALYMSIASILSVVATGRYELAIMLPKKDADAINLVALSIIISFLISFISFLIVYIFNSDITLLLGNNEISIWLYFIPITVLLTGFYQSVNYWSNRKKHYRRLAKNRVIQSGTTSTTNICMGLSGFESSGLILGSVLGQSVATAILVKMAWMEDNIIVNHVTKLKIFALIKKYRKQPIFNLPNALIDGFRLSGINILIARFFSTEILGQFSLAWKMLQTPMSLICGSLSQVFFQKISSCNTDDLYRIILQLIIKTSLMAAPFYLFIYIFSVDIFIFVFGENWKLAGEAASIMSPWLYLNFITSPLSTLFIIINKQHILLIFALGYMVLPLSIIYIFRASNFLQVLRIATLSMSIMLLIFVLLVIYYAKKENI